MRSLLTIVSMIAVLGMGCGGAPKQAAGPLDPVEPTYSMEEVSTMAEGFTVALVNPEPEDDGKAHSYCTGVWVSESDILTAAHCVVGVTKHLEESDPEDAPARNVFETDYRYIVASENQGVNHEPSALHRARLVKIDRSHDLALLRTLRGGRPVHKFAHVAEELPGIGEHVVMVGHPRGMYFTHVEGVIAQYHKDLPTPKKGPFVQVNGTVFFGMSGGGCFDKHGHLLGIASFMPPVPNMGIYIHRDSLVNFLTESK